MRRDRLSSREEKHLGSIGKSTSHKVEKVGKHLFLLKNQNRGAASVQSILYKYLSQMPLLTGAQIQLEGSESIALF